MNNFHYSAAFSISEAVQEFAGNANANYIGGGTNIVDLWKYNLTSFNALIDLTSIKDYHNIEPTADGGVRIGAFATNADTAYHPLIEQSYPLLSKAILAGASAQIRNMATNGGNLLQRTRCYYFYDKATPCNKREPGTGCSAIGGYNRMMAVLGTSENCIAVFPSDMCIALAALEATVHVIGPDGDRSIPFADFHRLPRQTPQIDNNLKDGEIIIYIKLPPKKFTENYSYLKIRERNSYAFALVSVATGLEIIGDKIKEARIALGGVAHIPWRIATAEDFLIGKFPTDDQFGFAADIILEGAKGFGHNDFKIGLAKKAIVRNCMMALDPSTQRPGAQPSL